MTIRPSITRTFLRRYALVSAVSLLIIALAMAYVGGYRPSRGLTVVRAGTLVLVDLPAVALPWDEDSFVVVHGNEAYELTLGAVR